MFLATQNSSVPRTFSTIGTSSRPTSEKPRVRREKQQESILDDVPVHFPALLEGSKLTTGRKGGFDWENTDQIFEKLDEEVAELKAALMAATGVRSPQRSAICYSSL